LLAQRFKLGLPFFQMTSISALLTIELSMIAAHAHKQSRADVAMGGLFRRNGSGNFTFFDLAVAGIASK